MKAQSLGAPNMKLLVTLLLVSPAFGAKCAGYTTASDVAKGHDMSGKVVLITGVTGKTGTTGKPGKGKLWRTRKTSISLSLYIYIYLYM